MEKLNIQNMIRNHNLAQHILDASWGKFLHMLFYKAERADRMVVRVNPREASKKIPEGFDRDYVASVRILQLGLGRPEVTPVEMGPLLSVPASAVVCRASPANEAGSPLRKLGVVHEASDLR